MVVFIFLSTYFFDFLENIFRALQTLYLRGTQGIYMSKIRKKNKAYLKNSIYFLQIFEKYDSKTPKSKVVSVKNAV